MIYNKTIEGSENIEIDIEDNIFCSINLFTSNPAHGQIQEFWNLSEENCLSFKNNYKDGYAYIEDNKIKIIGNINYSIIFFKDNIV